MALCLRVLVQRTVQQEGLLTFGLPLRPPPSPDADANKAPPIAIATSAPTPAVISSLRTMRNHPKALRLRPQVQRTGREEGLVTFAFPAVPPVMPSRRGE